MPHNLEGLSAADVPKFVRVARRELSAAAPFLMMVIVLCLTIRLHGQANESGAQDSGSKSKEPAVTDSRASESNANADQQTQASPPRPIHIVPYGPAVKPPKTRPQASGALSNQGRVQYWGGPVISNVNVVEVLWGNFVDGPSTTGLDQFFTDITSSNYFGLLAEYSTVGLTGFGAGSPPGSNQTIGPGVFGGKFTISPSVCPGGATNPPCTINDTQIQNELVSQVNSSPPALPQPVQDNQGNFNTIYMIYFPPGVTIVAEPGVNSCQPRGFCAYHSNVLTGNKLPYGVLPDFSPASGCGPSRGCGNGTSFQNLTAASSHEFSEAVTDVDAGTANAFAPPLAWADQNTGAEIGDICAHDDVQVTANNNTYTVQTEWSNMQNNCVSAPGHFQLVAPSTVIPNRPFNMAVTAEPSFNGFQLFGYNNTVHFTTSDQGPPIPTLPPDYTFVPATDNGTHTFSVTLSTLGNQTITATDTLITAMTGTTTVNVAHNPDVTVSSSHSGNFKQGDASDTYILTVTNVGDLTTSGTVTVTDTVPFGLTATAASGMGWNCSVLSSSSATCTRSDGLAPSTPYPPITLTVSVATFAPAAVTNNVQVAGGGEFNTANDTATDLTLVTQMPDLTITKSHAGSFSQGQVNANYTLTVGNFGFAPTNGTLVTVTDTLPTGLTATAIGGTGWSCSAPPTLTCTRSDVLNNGGSYPPITLAVNVAVSAPMPTVTNTATVSGGGEINLANDNAGDVTTITPPAPDLVVASTHSGSFTQGQTGATYTLTVSNIGPVATNAAVSFTDGLPSFFTATSMSGPGWTCTLSTLTCTRSDALPGFTSGSPASYPPVTLTVNVANNAPTPITNFASVSGGGELDTGNDTAFDSTVIIQLPDLVPTQSHGQLVQGLTGANYMLIVNNFANATTSGTVTVTDMLPSALTATAMSGPGWNCSVGTLTCTRSDALGPFSSYPAITLTVNVANNAPSSVTNTVTVSGGGEIVTSNDTSTDTAPVSPPVSILVVTGTMAVTAGSSVNFMFFVNAPLPSATNFSCSGLPAGAACMFNPSSVSGQVFATVIMTITTTGGVASASPLPRYAPPPLYAILLPLLGIVGMGMRPRGVRKPLWVVVGVVGLALVLFLAGCGGGGNGGPPPPPPRTPAGTYTITVTGNNPTVNFQASATVTLQVQ